MQRWKSEQRPRLPPAPQVVQTAQLQNEMNHVLNEDTLSPSEKARQYGEVLHKFQQSHEKARSPSVPTVSPAPPSPTTTTPPSLQDRILESVPHTMRCKAQLLMGMLKQHPHMTWNEQGVLEYEGKPAHGSNMIDLVNDVLR
ncbi:hypothetical protein ACF0H5_001812 [Mactra antiquata]